MRNTLMLLLLIGVIALVVILSNVYRPSSLQSNILVPDSLFISPNSFTRVLSERDFWERNLPVLINSSTAMVKSELNGKFTIEDSDKEYGVKIKKTNQLKFSITITYKSHVIIYGYIRYVALAPYMLSVEMNQLLDPTKNFRIFFQWKNFMTPDVPSNFLEAAYAYLTSTKSLYGFSIQRTKVIDTLLLTKRDTVISGQIYCRFNTIADSLILQAKHMFLEPYNENSPIFHIDSIYGQPNKYVLFVGVNIKKRPVKKEALFMEMPPGNVIVLKYTGGKYLQNQAGQAIKLYVFENLLQQPFLSWSRIVGVKRPYNLSDSLKWKHTLSFPIL